MRKVIVGVLALTLVSCGSEDKGQESQVDLGEVNSTHSSSETLNPGNVENLPLMISYAKNDNGEVIALMKDNGCYKSSLVKKYDNIEEHKIEKLESCEKLSSFVHFNSKKVVVILNPIHNRYYSDSQICNLENMTYGFYHSGVLEFQALPWLDAMGQVFPHYDAGVSDNGKNRFYQGDAQFCGNHVEKIHANFYNFAEYKKGF